MINPKQAEGTETAAEHNVPQRRKLLMAIASALGGAALLEGCATDSGALAEGEHVGEVDQALSGTAIRWVDSVSGDLATKNSSALGYAVAVIAKGRLYPGDGAGGVFYWEANNTTGHDNGMIIVPQPSPTGRWRRISSGVRNVKWFGAKGDGSDDTIAVRDAIQSAAALATSAVYFPPGAYVVDVAGGAIALVSGMRLHGEGDASVLDIRGGNNSNLFAATGQSGIEICGLRFIAGNDSLLVLRATNCRNISVHGNSCFGPCLVHTASTLGGYGTTGSSYQNVTDENSCSQISVCDNRLSGKGDPITTSAAIGMYFVNGGLIANNTIEKYGYGICWWGGDAYPEKDGSLANPRKVSDLVISGNIVKHVGASNVSGSGGAIWGSMGTRITVSGNECDHGTDVGIDFEGSTECIATGNTVREFVYGCLSTNHYNRDVRFVGNNCFSSGGTFLASLANPAHTDNNDGAVLRDNQFVCGSGIAEIYFDMGRRYEFTGNTLRNCIVKFGGTGAQIWQQIVTGNTLFFDQIIAPHDCALQIGYMGGTTAVRNDIRCEDNSIVSTLAQPGTVAISHFEANGYRKTYVSIKNNRISGEFSTHIKLRSIGAHAPAGEISGNWMGSAAIDRVDGGAEPSSWDVSNNKGVDGRVNWPGVVPNSQSYNMQWDTGCMLRLNSPAPGASLAICTTGGIPGTWVTV